MLPEVWFTGGMVLLVGLISLIYRLPIKLPSGERASAVGIHYLYPLIGIGAWGVFALIGQRTRLASTFLIAFPCYAMVLLCHFTLKLWVPHINPTLWDALYWDIDQKLRPVVLACFATRRLVAPLFPIGSNSYMVAFITMFYISFCFHAWRTPEAFRMLFLAALFFQGLGALAYLVMPAIGPFIYETGISPVQTGAQMSMLADYREHVAVGTAWLEQYGGTRITVGLAAMPSLHAGGSFLFLLVAWRHARTLVPIYAVLFFFIATAAVANRWHYVIDVPIGMALAWACVAIAARLAPVPYEKTDDLAVPELAPALA